MSLRDLFLFSFLLVVVVVSLRRPFVGGLAWVLFGVMNPHRMTWGYAYNFPFALVIAIVTLLGMLLSKQHRELKGGAAVGVLVFYLLWMCVTTAFAFQPEPALAYLIKVVKIFGMTLVLLALMSTRRDVLLVISTLVLSLGFYGTKGGVFVVATAGDYMVNGPPDSVMEGNNALGVGLTMVIPLMYFLLQQTQRVWLRYLLIASMLLCSISVLGAYSRGAMLAIGAMSILLWLRGKNKLVMLALAAILVAVAIPAMPERWYAKMDTLEGYKEDDSAMFRLYAWQTAYNIAKDRFPVAGGFEWENPAASLKYSPLPTLVLVAHSIYFEVIGSQGFIGLVFHLIFWFLVWRKCAWLRRFGRDGPPDRLWYFQLGSMVQVALVGYFVGGAFLNLAYWDLPYYLFAAVAAAEYAAERQASAAAAPGSTAQSTKAVGPPAGATAAGAPTRAAAGQAVRRPSLA